MKIKTIYDLGAKPMNTAAARAIMPSIADNQYEFTPKPNVQIEWDTPPPTVNTLQRKPTEKRPIDYTGRTFGRLTVMFYFGCTKRNSNGNGGGQDRQKWACRCTCGRYVIRSAKTISSPKDPDDKCQQCRQLAYLKKEDRRKQLKEI